MILLPEPLRLALRLQSDRAAAAEARGIALDPAPLLKLFDPLGPATWLATELGRDGDTLFGLADLGFGCPELGYFSLRAIASVRLPFGLRIERDVTFQSQNPLSVWVDQARRAGSIRAAETELVREAFRPARIDPHRRFPASNDDGEDRPDG
ncbi:hypothetical protein ACFB49_22100 [Sphingomonas sp. DBB INV C78]|uniref:DUF2958 domain-containing protein n=1 Tax=Sphingomonas sp. DBB INV C78 TaxID=3349434 RepID=UPI0036D3FC98